MTEKQLQKQIVEFLNYNGCNVWMTNAGQVPIGDTGRRIKVGFAGLSDIIGIRRRDGRFIAIEVKLPKRRKNVSDKQAEFLAKTKLFGGIVGVATSPEEALQIIEERISYEQ